MQHAVEPLLPLGALLVVCRLQPRVPIIQRDIPFVVGVNLAEQLEISALPSNQSPVTASAPGTWP